MEHPEQELVEAGGDDKRHRHNDAGLPLDDTTQDRVERQEHQDHHDRREFQRTYLERYYPWHAKIAPGDGQKTGAGDYKTDHAQGPRRAKRYFFGIVSRNAAP